MSIATFYYKYTYLGCSTDTDVWGITWPSAVVGEISQSCPGSQSK